MSKEAAREAVGRAGRARTHVRLQARHRAEGRGSAFSGMRFSARVHRVDAHSSRLKQQEVHRRLRRHPLADQRGGWRSARSMRCFDGGGLITAAYRCRITMAALDAGYETSHVLEFCKGRRDIIAVRGVSGSYKPPIAKVKSEKHDKRGDVLRHPRDGYFTVGVDSIKSQLFVDLAKDDPDAAGYIAFPSDCEDRLFQELTAEHRVAVKRMGMIVFRWEKVSDRQANELLDCYVYSQAAMARHGCQLDLRRAVGELEAQCEGKPHTPKPSLAEKLAAEMPHWG